MTVQTAPNVLSTVVAGEDLAAARFHTIAMDDGKFGGLNALPNGVVIRLFTNGVYQTLTHWKSNADLKDDMYDVTYSAKAPTGQHGLSSRWTFTKGGFVADLDGTTGDYLEVLIQDDLTGLLDFEVKGQGRLFGG